MVVYILNCQGKPLMPCSSSKARKLLKNNKAVVIKKVPFTLKLLYPCADRVQEVIAGMDSGSKVIGTAAIANGETVYQAETILRGEEIKRKMEQRAMYRRTRRARKLRYRKPRFLNRRASTRLDRLPPSIKHKVVSHLREKGFLESVLPISKWFVETASFDIHKISDPTVSKKHGWTYQKGQKLGYYNTRAFVLARDKHTCGKCNKN
ncbi:MAG: HNH endonuclease, partial [Deltaproteobacteria bacterium]